MEHFDNVSPLDNPDFSKSFSHLYELEGSYFDGTIILKLGKIVQPQKKNQITFNQVFTKVIIIIMRVTKNLINSNNIRNFNNFKHKLGITGTVTINNLIPNIKW